MGRRKLLVLLLGLPMLFGACRTAPIYDVKNAALPSPPGGKPLTIEDVAKAIAATGKQLGWQIDEVRPGELTGTLKVKSHVAVVSIVHDTSKYSITYKDSTKHAEIARRPRPGPL